VAAISAYRAYSNKFNQIEHIAQRNMYENIDEIKAKVVGRYSISEAIGNKKANRK
jgi:predicted RNase H-like nuclease (RuvC/YqgF family)